MLTHRQRDLLLFINERFATDGVCPSYDEMADGLGSVARANVSRLVAGLEERGFIRRVPGKARSIEVIRLPVSAAA